MSQTAEEQAGDERRLATRRIVEAGEPLAKVRMRTGTELTVVNISPAGALVEGSVRLLPGVRIDVHVMTHAGRQLVRARVVRASLSSVRRNQVRYTGALQFDLAVDTTAHEPTARG